MASKSVGLLNIVFGADLRGFDRAMKKAQKNLKKFGSSMKRTGANLTRNLTMPIIAVGAASAKMALDFDKSMTKINTLVGVSAEEVEKLKKQVLELSGKTATAPNELAEGLYFLTSAGLSGTDAMEALEQVSKGVASGLGESADLANVAAAAQNAYGKETLSASKALDIFGGMVKTGMFDASELSQVLGTQLGLAASLGISFEEVGAMISTYTKTTGDANAATTGLSGVMMSFAKITPKQAAALDDVGLSAKSVKEMLSKKGLQGTLLEMQKRFKANNIPLSEFFSKSQSLKAVLGVLGNQTETYTEILDDLGDSVGFVDNAFEKTSQTSSFKMEQALNSLKVAATQLGQELFPVVDAIAKKIKSLTDWFSSLDDSQKKNFVTWGLILAAIGPVLSIIGQMSTGMSALIPIMTKLGAVMIANPYLALAAGITAIVVAVRSAIKSNKKYADSMAGIKDANSTAEKSIMGQRLEVERLTKQLKDENTTLADKEEALKELNKIAPEYYGRINAAKLDVEKLDTATQNYISTLREEARTIAMKDKLVEIERKLFDKRQEFMQMFEGKSELEQVWDIVAGGDMSNLFTAVTTGRIGIMQQTDEIKGLQAQAEELEKLLAVIEGKQKKVFVSDSSTGGESKNKADAPTTFTEDVDLMPVLSTWEQEAEKSAEKIFKPFGDMGKNEFLKLAGELETEWEKTGKTLEEQTAYTLSIVVEEFQKAMDDIKKVLSGLGDVFSAINTKESAEFDIWKKRQEERSELIDSEHQQRIENVENSTLSEEEKQKRIEEMEAAAADKKAAIDAQIEQKENALKRKQAKRDKAMNISSAIMNTAEAVTEVIANPILAGIVGALGAVQVATIAATPIPFAKGGLVSGPVLGMVGEGSGTSAFNPEVISPLDKLMGMMGSSQVDVHGRIEGNNIVLVSEKATINRERFI